MQNFVDPAILFFVFGVLAGALKSNLEIPKSIAKFLSLYLLMALGLKGGFALAQSGFTVTIALSLAAALIMAFIVPAIGYAFLQKPHFPLRCGGGGRGLWLGQRRHLRDRDPVHGDGGPFARRPHGGRHGDHGIARHHHGGAARQFDPPHAGPGRRGRRRRAPLGKILHESFTDGAHLLLLGSMAVGFISGDAGKSMMQPFSGDLFKGMLAFFLLDMGLMVAKNFNDAVKASPALIGYAVVSPFVHAGLALGLSLLIGLPVADAALLMVLSASASYIVVPAVLRYAIPEANPAIYFGLSLGVTFPLNILIGIPLYTSIAQRVIGGG